MMEYGQLYIIPNEDKILGSCFHREVISGHLEGIQEFCDIYQLDYHFNLFWV